MLDLNLERRPLWCVARSNDSDPLPLLYLFLGVINRDGLVVRVHDDGIAGIGFASQATSNLLSLQLFQLAWMSTRFLWSQAWGRQCVWVNHGSTSSIIILVRTGHAILVSAHLLHGHVVRVRIIDTRHHNQQSILQLLDGHSATYLARTLCYWAQQWTSDRNSIQNHLASTSHYGFSY